MQKDVAEAVSTFEDRQKAEARVKVGVMSREMVYFLNKTIGVGMDSTRRWM